MMNAQKTRCDSVSKKKKPKEVFFQIFPTLHMYVCDIDTAEDRIFLKLTHRQLPKSVAIQWSKLKKIKTKAKTKLNKTSKISEEEEKTAKRQKGTR